MVTGPVNLPEKMIPFGRPDVPFPVMVKLPPPWNVETLPVVEINAPVEKLKVPRFDPVIWPPPPKPVTEMTSDPVSVRPELQPLRVPPLLLKSTWSANAAMGNAKASRVNNNIRFIIASSWCVLGELFIYKTLWGGLSPQLWPEREIRRHCLHLRDQI